MTSHGLFQNPERCDGVIRKVLFEDDQDLYRILSGFFKLRRRGLYLAAIAAFIIVVALLGELGGWQNLNDNDKATYDFGEFSGQADSPILTSVGSTDDVANHFGPFAT